MVDPTSLLETADKHYREQAVSQTHPSRAIAESMASSFKEAKARQEQAVMSDEQGLEFDLEPKRVKVRIGAAWYWLQEASGDAGTKYRSAAVAAARMDDGKVVSVQGVADVEPRLVAACLYETRGKDDPEYRYRKGKDGAPSPVSEDFIRALPGRIQTVLFDRVMEMSPWLKDRDTPESIRKAEELLARRKKALADGSADPKNSPPAGEDGSGSATS